MVKAFFSEVRVLELAVNQEQLPADVPQNSNAEKLCNIHRNIPLIECLFNDAADLQRRTLQKSDSSQVFACYFRKMF